MSNSTLMRTSDAQRIVFEVLTEDRAIDIQDEEDFNLIDVGELYGIRRLLARFKLELAQAFVDQSLPQGPVARRHTKRSKFRERQP